MTLKINENFCNYVKKYVESMERIEGRGFRTRFAKKIKVTPGQLSSIVAGRKPTDEEKRRFIADVMGVDYDVMIGRITADLSDTITLTDSVKLELIKGQAEPSNVIPFNNGSAPLSPEQHKRATLIQRLDTILESGNNVLISAIESNLVAFAEDVEARKERDQLKKQVSELEAWKRQVESAR